MRRSRAIRLGSRLMGPSGARDRVLTVPNVLSGIRLVLIPVFYYLLLVAHADAWAVAILVFSGASDWADGKIARLLDQSSRLGELLDPAVDRLYMVSIPVAFGLRGIVPWWIIAVLFARDALLAAELPVLRTRGFTALPVLYIGKAATFALMSAFPLILLGQWDAQWSRVILACGWAFLIWGLYMYLWSFILYVAQMVLVVRRLPRVQAATCTRRGAHSSSPCRRCCAPCSPNIWTPVTRRRPPGGSARTCREAELPAGFGRRWRRCWWRRCSPRPSRRPGWWRPASVPSSRCCCAACAPRRPPPVS